MKGRFIIAKELQVFENEEFGTIRTVEIENEPYFVGKDVAEILGYKNPRDALNKRVDKEDKGVANCDTLGGSQEMTVINESGLYSLILSSKLPSAKKFKRWVTSEVLPTIRKHGMYATDELLNNPDFAIATFQALKEEREQRMALECECNRQKQIIGELKPKADYTDIILQSKSLMTITQIAKDYGMSGRTMNELLHKFGIQYKQQGQWCYIPSITITALLIQKPYRYIIRTVIMILYYILNGLKRVDCSFTIYLKTTA